MSRTEQAVWRISLRARIQEVGVIVKQNTFDVPVSVGLTAFAACAARAVEGSRPDRLVDDPFAASFVHGANLGNQLPLSIDEIEKESMLSSRFAGVRARVFDDFLGNAVDSGTDQVVILAAGLDARAFRLPWSSHVDLYELDHPDVLDFKNAVLADIGAKAHCRRHVVRADLVGNWSHLLQAEGFDPNRRTAWIAEGLLPYLGAQAEHDLLHTIRSISTPGSEFCLEYMPPDVVAKFRDHPRLEVTSDALGVPIRDMWNSETRDGTSDILRGLGWKVEFRSLDESGRVMGAPLEDEFTTPPSVSSGYNFVHDMSRCGYLTGELTAVPRS